LATARPAIAGSLEEFDLAMNRQGFIGRRVLPVFNTQVQAGPFGKITIESLLKGGNTERAPGSRYNRGDWDFTADSYATKEQGWEEPVDDREARMYADYFDAERVSTERARNVVMQNAEKRIADSVFNATTWTGSLLTTGITNEWDDPTNAIPIDDVEAAARLVRANTGLWPNALIINRKVFRNLRNCDQIVERIQSAGAGFPTRPADITVAQLAAVFDLPNIIVAGGAYDSAKEGQSTVVAELWSDEYAMVARIAESRDIREPCLGRTFHWSEDGSLLDGMVESYRDETVRSEIIRCRHDVHEKILYPECGHLLSNVTKI
jgi:hypothetical protein